MKRMKYWEIAHDLSATCAWILLPSLNILTKSNTRQTHAKLCIYWELFFSNYLWVTVLRQDLQHRRFSALNVSNKNQFASHHQRLCISSFLHGFVVGPLSFPIPQKLNHSEPAQEKKKTMRAWWTAVRLGGCALWIWLNLPLRLFIQARDSQWELTHSTGCCCCYTQRAPQPDWFVPSRTEE